jgi:glycosyltransferase involved in cell wall biosynthesis
VNQPTLLMVGYHFPPLAGSSGIQRPLGFVRHLPAHGIRTVVLTTHPRAYEQTREDLLGELPESCTVLRAPAWDTARHLAIAGRYPRALASPDRWASWYPGALVTGLRAIRRYQPFAIWATFPVATALRIGASLARRSGLPLLADFRDPMVQPDYPPDPEIKAHWQRIETDVMDRAALVTLTTPSAVEDYRTRYPAAAGRIELLENGYEEAAFEGLTATPPLTPGKVTVLHSGIVYGSERDPTALFQALALLKERSPGCYRRLSLRFRASSNDGLLRELGERAGVSEAVELLPGLPYREALQEMLSADALLLLQAANCNAQIPAKLYEYLRAGRPILGLTDAAGDTAAKLRTQGVESLAALDDAEAIAAALATLVQRLESQVPPAVAASCTESRAVRTRAWVACLRQRGLLP